MAILLNSFVGGDKIYYGPNVVSSKHVCDATRYLTLCFSRRKISGQVANSFAPRRSRASEIFQSRN